MTNAEEYMSWYEGEERFDLPDEGDPLGRLEHLTVKVRGLPSPDDPQEGGDIYATAHILADESVVVTIDDGYGDSTSPEAAYASYEEAWSAHLSSVCD